MPSRICPKCKKTLGSNDYYYCSNCGTPLSANLIRKPTVVKTSLFVASQTQSSKVFRNFLSKAHKIAEKIFTKKNVFMGLAFFLIASNVILVILLTGRSFLFPKEEENPTVLVYPNILDLGLNSPPEVFGSDNIATYVPKNAGFYLEGFDYDGLVSRYMPPDIPYKDVIVKSQSMLSGHFAVFATKINGIWEWTGIFIPVNLTAAEEELNSLSIEPAKYRFIDDKLVVTTNEEILDLVEEAKNQTAVNITLTPAYSSARAKLPKDGQIMVMFLTSDSSEIVQEIEKVNTSRLLASSIDRIIKSGYNDLVIKQIIFKVQ